LLQQDQIIIKQTDKTNDDDGNNNNNNLILHCSGKGCIELSLIHFCGIPVQEYLKLRKAVPMRKHNAEGE
jgi:hypothetical protein